MLGLGAALSGPYVSNVGSHNLHGGGWQASGMDFEAELTNLKTSVDATQRSLSQLENKLGGRLEHTCRRHVEDALDGSRHLQEVKQGLSRLQHECRHLGLEAGRLPSAQDVDEALERHRHTVEERITERINNLEHTVTQQQKLAVERMEGRGGETWRVCLQRMSALEERAVMQSDTSRLIEHCLNEVRRAGPELFGAAGTSPAADVSMLKSAFRKLEVKLAGCEARVLGLSEDSGAEGRVWRASMGAKVETMGRQHQDMSGRLAGCEAGLKAAEENTRLTLESAQASALEAQRRAESAEALILDAKADALKHAEVVLQNALVGLDARTQERAEAQRRDVSNLQKQLQELALEVVALKQESTQGGKDRALAKEKVAHVSTEMEALIARVNVVGTTAKETSEQELVRAMAAIRQEFQLSLAKSFEPLKATMDQLNVRVSASDGRMNATAKQIDGLEVNVARLGARTLAPSKAMEQMVSTMSGFNIANSQHASKIILSQSVSSPQASMDIHQPSISHRPEGVNVVGLHQSSISSLDRPESVKVIGLHQPPISHYTPEPIHVISHRTPESIHAFMSDQIKEQEAEQVQSSAQPPVYSFGHGDDRPPRIPAEVEKYPSVPDPSFGEVSRVETQTFVSNTPALSPGEVHDSSVSALMSATPSRVPGDAIGEETGIAPSAFFEDEGHNSWDEAEEEENRVPAVDGDIQSPPTLAPIQAESEGSNFSAPLPEDSIGDHMVVSQPQAATHQHVTPASTQQSPNEPQKSLHPPAPRASSTSEGAVSLDTAAAMQLANDVEQQEPSFQQEVSDWDISGSLEGEAAMQAAKRAEMLRSQNAGQQEVPQVSPTIPQSELAGSDFDVSGSWDGRSSTKSRRGETRAKRVRELEGSISDWDASGSLEGKAFQEPLSKASVTTPQMPKAKTRPHLAPEHIEQAGSDWDASGSLDGLATQAIPKTPNFSNTPLASRPENLGTHRMDESLSDWDASGSLDGPALRLATKAAAKLPTKAAAKTSSTPIAKTAQATTSAPVGIGGASRFGVQSSLDVLQDSNSFDDPGPNARLEGSNSWDMGSPATSPLAKVGSKAQPFSKPKPAAKELAAPVVAPQSGQLRTREQQRQQPAADSDDDGFSQQGAKAGSKAQPFAKPKPAAKEPVAAVVGPQSGQLSARQQDLAAELGLDLNSEDDQIDDDDDVSLPGM